MISITRLLFVMTASVVMSYMFVQKNGNDIYRTLSIRQQIRDTPSESPRTLKKNLMSLDDDDDDSSEMEPMFSVSYDPLEPPNADTMARDLEDQTIERALRFFDKKLVVRQEKCYLVGLEDRSTSGQDETLFSLEESLSELSELAGAAGLTVVGSTFQRVPRPSIEYYIGPGKLKDIAKTLTKLKCNCVIFDIELSPSQQKNLEIAFNQENKSSKTTIKVVDRTALILDIFAQHARSREGQLQVQLALLTYRLPRLTNLWSHLERQASGARGRSNGGVGLRGPGEKQLESDRRQMKSKISALNRAIDSVRRHRAIHRGRRRLLGSPVIALVGYTNAGKSTVLNTLAGSGGNVLVADMLFATLDPTTRLVKMSGSSHRFPEMLLTDTVGFIQKLPTNLVAAFRATLEEIAEADILLHITDVSNPSWRKQHASVLRELTDMGLSDKPVVTFWNKADLMPDRSEFFKAEAAKRPLTVCGSALTGDGVVTLASAIEQALADQLHPLDTCIPHSLLAEEGGGSLLAAVHRLGVLEAVHATEEGTVIQGRVPLFLKRQLEELLVKNSPEVQLDMEDEEYDWRELAKGRHRKSKRSVCEDDLMLSEWTDSDSEEGEEEDELVYLASLLEDEDDE